MNCLFCFQRQINAFQILAMAMELVRLWHEEINVYMNVPVILVTKWRMTAVKVNLSNENEVKIRAILNDNLIRSSINILWKEIISNEMNWDDWLQITVPLLSFWQKEIHFFSNINFPDKWYNQNVPNKTVKGRFSHENWWIFFSEWFSSWRLMSCKNETFTVAEIFRAQPTFLHVSLILYIWIFNQNKLFNIF